MTETRTIRKVLPFFLLIILLFSSQLVFSQQEVVVKGMVMDSLEQAALDSCSVTIKIPGKEFRCYTNSKGSFLFKAELNADTILLIISRKNFQAFSRQLPVRNNLADAGTIQLTPASRIMEDIVIIARTPAMVVRNDTTDYTIDSFEKKKGAMIGDVLKDLPGFEIDEEGKILHPGKHLFFCFGIHHLQL